jgi:hypothetical protein
MLSKNGKSPTSMDCAPPLADTAREVRHCARGTLDTGVPHVSWFLEMFPGSGRGLFRGFKPCDL